MTVIPNTITTTLQQSRLEMDHIEQIIDRHSLPSVLDAIACICSMKSDHIRENWQDEKLADGWDNAASRLLICAQKVREHL